MDDQESELMNIRKHGVKKTQLLQSGWRDSCEMYYLYNEQGTDAYKSDKFNDWLIHYGLVKGRDGAFPIEFPIRCYPLKNGVAVEESVSLPTNFLQKDCSQLSNNCVTGFDTCTMFNSRDPIAKVCNTYLDAIDCTPNKGNPSGKCNTMIQGICKTHPELPECQCVNRNQYPEWNKWSSDFLKYGSYKPDSNEDSKKEVPPAKCWYPYCQNPWLWIDEKAFPPNGETCGDIRYCNKDINLDNNTVISSIVNIVNTPCNCVSDADCKEGLKCIRNECIECSVDTDCPKGKLCNNGLCKECITDKECRTDQHCDTGNGKCVECVLSSQCDKNFYCVDNKCIQCDNNVLFCPDEKFCINNRCVECLVDTDCADNKLCVDNTCVSPDTPDQSFLQPYKWIILGVGISVLLIIVILLIGMSKNTTQTEYYYY